MIYITRHGETLWNTKKILQGHLNSPLTENGINNLHSLREKLRHIPFKAIVSSPLERALNSAEILNSDRKLDVILIDELKEMSYGSWQGVPMEELMEKDGENYHNYMYRPELYIANNGGETFEEMIARTRVGFNKLCVLGQTDDILVVTHGVTIMIILMLIDGRELKELWQPPKAENAGILIINSENEPKVVDASVLKEE